MATDRRRLQDMLAKLATETSTIEKGWRRIGETSGAPLSALAAEIDETLYPVRLSVKNADGETVDLAVGHRRLHCVLGELPKPLAGYAEVSARALSDPGSDEFAQVSEMLRSHLAAGGPLWVRTSAAPDEAMVSSGGISARKLAEAWADAAPPENAEATAAAFEEFAEQLASTSAAWVRLSDRSVSGSSGQTAFGSDEEIIALAEWFSALSHSRNGPTLVICQGNQGAWCYASTRSADTCLVAEVSEDVARSLPGQWRGSGL